MLEVTKTPVLSTTLIPVDKSTFATSVSFATNLRSLLILRFNPKCRVLNPKIVLKSNFQIVYSGIPTAYGVSIKVQLLFSVISISTINCHQVGSLTLSTLITQTQMSCVKILTQMVLVRLAMTGPMKLDLWSLVRTMSFE